MTALMRIIPSTAPNRSIFCEKRFIAGCPRRVGLLLTAQLLGLRLGLSRFGKHSFAGINVP